MHAARPRSPTPDRRTLVFVVAGWAVAGVASAIWLRGRAGVFGEAVPLADGVRAGLVHAFPWLLAALAALWAAARWRFAPGDRLHDLTLHLAFAMVVVVLQQVVLAALRAWVVPFGLRPLDPWAQLPLDLVRWAPVALAVQAVLVALALFTTSPRPEAGPHD